LQPLRAIRRIAYGFDNVLTLIDYFCGSFLGTRLYFLPLLRTAGGAMKYYMSYSTANEGDYKEDLFNFSCLAMQSPGVKKIYLYISVSEAREASKRDNRILSRLARIAESNRSIEVRSVRKKSNIGRDFSSAAFNLRLISQEAHDEDFILFVNRSCYGPLSDNWYAKYVEQYCRYEQVALCGSTINFSGHPEGRNRTNTTHVQTYMFLSQFQWMKVFLEHYPAEDEAKRIDIIDNGEILLSQRIIERGGALTCLAWPQFKFDESMRTSSELPLYDIKSEVSALPFLYKRSSLHSIAFRFKFWRWRAALLMGRKSATEGFVVAPR
jgi:hypothetical protein